MPELAQRCAQDLALCYKPVAVGVSVLASALEPKMVSAIADGLFDVLHVLHVLHVVSSKFASGAPASPSFSDKAGGRYPAGLPRSTAGLTARFRRFVSESMQLGG
jgi:hypothetical protein